MSRWSEIRELFEQARTLTKAGRATLLERSDAGLREEINSLLQAYDAEQEAAARCLRSESAPGGKVYGNYVTERLLGRGGMGAVYLANRTDGEYQQRVALKVVAPHLATGYFQERFLQERQILAQLQHPKIARLLDGGRTAEGEPYLVMEYIEGIAIDHYCREHGLTLEERLRLFCEVCDAVEFAHQNLVVHRDLKPSNILVTGEGEVRLLDFGAAKLMRPGGVENTSVLAATPHFASPEQIRGGAVTTLSDEFSLGVTLYVLVTGERPFGNEADSVFRISAEILEKETPLASLSGSLPEGQRRKVAGDLDVILRKALEKDPARRYGSVADLARDIRRHLAGEPILARPATVAYRTGKFLRRHPIAVSTAAVSVAALLATTWYALEQARVARRESAKLRTVNQFIISMFRAASPAWLNPSANRSRSMTVLELVDNASSHMKELAAQPQVEAEMRTALGRIYSSLGKAREAQAQLQEVLAKQSASSAPQEEIAMTKRLLAGSYLIGAEYDRATPLLREVLVFARANGRSFSEEARAGAANDLATILMFKGTPETQAEAENLLREAADLGRRLPNSPARLIALTNLANLAMLRDPEKAEAIVQEVLAAERKIQPPPVEMFSPLTALALTRIYQRELGEAEALAREARELTLGRAGPDHSWSIRASVIWAIVKGEQGSFAESEATLRDALARFRATRPEGNIDLAFALVPLARVLTMSGKAGEAASLLQEAEDIHRAQKLPDDANLVFQTGYCTYARGDRENGEALMRRGVALFAQRSGETSLLVRSYRRDLNRILTGVR